MSDIKTHDAAPPEGAAETRQPDSNGHGCYPKPEAKTCNGDADCFCEACLKRCGAAGVKRCEFTDVTVWGSRPTVCECRS